MKLKEYRELNSLRQIDLAKLLNVTKQTVYNLEASKAVIYNGVIYKPCYVLEQLAESKEK